MSSLGGRKTVSKMGWVPVTHAPDARPLGSIEPLLYPPRRDPAHPGSPSLALAKPRHHRAGLSLVPSTNRNLHLGSSFTASQLDQGNKKCAPRPIGLGSLRVWALFLCFLVSGWALQVWARGTGGVPRDDEKRKMLTPLPLIPNQDTVDKDLWGVQSGYDHGGVPWKQKSAGHTQTQPPQLCFHSVLCRESPDQGAVIKLPVPEKGADSQGGWGREFQSREHGSFAARRSAGWVRRAWAFLACDLRNTKISEKTWPEKNSWCLGSWTQPPGREAISSASTGAPAPSRGWRGGDGGLACFLPPGNKREGLHDPHLCQKPIQERIKQEPWFHSPAVPGLPPREGPWQERPFQQEELTRERSAFLLWSPVFWALVSWAPKLVLTVQQPSLVQTFSKIMASPQAPTKQPQRILEDVDPQGPSASLWRPASSWSPGLGVLEHREEGSTASEARSLDKTST